MVAMKSFTSETVYHIHVSDTTGEALSCDCPSYFYGYQRQRQAGSARFQCKHMIRHNESVEKENAASRSRYHFAQYDF